MASLRVNEVWFRSFVEATSQVIWVADAEGNVTEVSSAWANFTGQAPEEVVGWGWAEALHPQERPYIIEQWAKHIAARLPYSVELKVRRHDGIYHRFLNRGVPVIEEDVFLGWIGTCTDIEQQKRIEETARENKIALIRRERLLQGVATALGFLLADDLDDAIFNAFRLLGEVTDADRVYLFELTEDETTGSYLANQRYEWAQQQVIPQIDNPDLQNVPLFEAGFSQWLDIFKTGAPIAALVQERPLSEQPLLEQQDIQSFLVVPIHLDGALWGFMGFDDCRTKRIWSSTEQAMLKAVASSVGEAILRQRHRAKIEQREEQLRLALEAAKMGFWQTDLSTGIIQCSGRTMTLLGLPEGVSKLSTATLYDALVEEDRLRALSIRKAGLEKAAEQGSASLVIEYRLRGHQPERWVRSMGRVQVDEYGKPARIIGTVLEITDEKAYKAGLIKAKEVAEAAWVQAEEAAQAKSVLLANMSHELRTPLTSIIGFAEILTDLIAKEHLEFAECIVRGGRRLRDTLTHVLDLAEIEAGQARLNPTEVNIGAIVMDATNAHRAQIVQKNLRLQVLLPETPVMLTTDQAIFTRIVTCLVSNAIKFTSEGGITISVRANDHAIEMDVADTGVGISTTFVPRLFDPFRQESEGEARHFQGTGLGLAISKRLVNLLGGEVHVESSKGVGSTFRVRLPRTR